MALLAHALASVGELRPYVGAEGAGQDGNFETALNAATEWLERQANRHFVTRGNVTEYHHLGRARHELKLSRYPTIAVVSIHESHSTPPVHDSATLLVADTDYVVDKDIGVLKRVMGGCLTTWSTGYRAIKAVHSYGYRKADGTPVEAQPVPDDLKLLCLFVAASIFKESDRARWGVSSVTDALGSVTRFLGYLPPDMQRQLEAYRPGPTRDRTWELA